MLRLPVYKCFGTAVGGLPRSPRPYSVQPELPLKLSSKLCLEKADDVGYFCTRANVPENLSRNSLKTSTEMVKHVLVIPLQVTGHALELRQERVQAASPIVLL